MTRYQCIQYALDRPGVLSVVPGVRNMKDLEALIGFAEAPMEERDYSMIGQFTPEAAMSNCVYCNHCQPCPAGIDVGLVNKYYDLALAGMPWQQIIMKNFALRQMPVLDAVIVIIVVRSIQRRARE